MAAFNAQFSVLLYWFEVIKIYLNLSSKAETNPTWIDCSEGRRDPGDRLLDKLSPGFNEILDRLFLKSNRYISE